jgi:translocation and assembly module TamA
MVPVVRLRQVATLLLVALATAASPARADALEVSADERAAAEARRAAVEQPPAAGVVEVTVEGVDDAQRAAVLAALDIARYTSRRTIGSARLDRLVREAPAQARGALEPFGYYQPRVEVVRTPLADRRHRIEVGIVLGEPTRVVALDLGVDGEAAEDPTIVAALAAFRPQVGEPLDHRVYEDGKAAIDRALVRRGYFDRSLLVHRVEVTRADSTAVVRLRFDSGPRFRFGGQRIEGAQFPDRFMQRFIAWERDAPYEQGSIEATQNRLAASGFFGAFEIEPLVDERAEGVVPMRIGVSPSRPTVWSAGAFVESGIGAGLRVGHERRWLNDRGHSARANAELSSVVRELVGEYRVPHPSSQRANWVLGLGWRDETSDVVDGTSWRLQGGLSTTWREWSGLASMNALYGDFRVGAREFGVRPQTALIVFPEVSATRIFARDRIRPREGYSISIRARVADTALGSDVSLRQLRAEGRHVLPVGEGARLLSRLELGWTDTDSFSRLPPDLRFFAGGQGSVRGYDWKGLGPLDADGRPFGGPRVITGSLEYEREFRPAFSWAAFVDGGNVFFGSRVDPLYGAGFGIRWASPVGPIRVDIARGLDSERGGWKFYLSAGPDL